MNWDDLAKAAIDYWRNSSAQIIRLVKPGMVVLDVGAGHGTFSLALAHQVGPTGQVHVFEPDVTCFRQLQKRFESSRFPQVILRNIALFHKSGSQALNPAEGRLPLSLITLVAHDPKLAALRVKRFLSHCEQLKPVSHSLAAIWHKVNKARLKLSAIQSEKLHASRSDAVPGEISMIECMTLDDYAKAFLSRIDIMYVDVNGYEAHVLLGSFETIRVYRPVIIMNVCEKSICHNGFCAHYLLQWLKALGYSPFSEDGISYSTFEAIEVEAESDPSYNIKVIFKPEVKPFLTSSVMDLSPILPQASESLADMKSLRYVFAYTAYNSWIQSWYEDRLARLRGRGYLVEGFCVTLNPPGPAQSWPNLDQRWRRRDPQLLEMYERLVSHLSKSDVLINYNGANLHPDFVRQLSTFNVFVCFDDPEASEYLSRYVATGFDFAFVGNAGCLDMYRSWGIQNLDFLPLGVSDSDRDLTLTEEDILTGQREVPIVYLGSRDKHRDLWVDPLISAFPDTVVYGYGWPNSYLPQNQQIALYRNSRIGWNMDQSVGPATSRTYKLPANGVLLIGNNRSHLGKLFELGVEVIGFDTLQECIDYTHYYLAHDEERRQIASRGWRRTITDYTDKAILDKMFSTIQLYYKNRP